MEWIADCTTCCTSLLNQRALAILSTEHHGLHLVFGLHMVPFSNWAWRSPLSKGFTLMLFHWCNILFRSASCSRYSCELTHPSIHPYKENLGTSGTAPVSKASWIWLTFCGPSITSWANGNISLHPPFFTCCEAYTICIPISHISCSGDKALIHSGGFSNPVHKVFWWSHPCVALFTALPFKRIHFFAFI